MPLALVAAVVFWGLRLPNSDSGLLAVVPSCAAGGDCPPAVASTSCEADSSCDSAGEAAPVTGDDAAPPAITARAAAVIEAPCGALLHGDDEHVRLAPASLTKIATALVTVDYAGLSEMVDVHVDGAELAATTDSTIMGLRPGLYLPMQDLLYGLLLSSGNDAALAIAEYVGFTVDDFVDLMNAKVAELGLTDTHFANPHGLDEPGLYTSAYDMAVLGESC